jgi:ADP-heptose:LPS heptosyltransferase
VRGIDSKKILVIKLQALGDILMMTPAVRILKQNHPEFSIDHLVFKHYKEVTQYNAYINSVIILDEKRCTFRGIFYLLSVISEIRKARYDIIINFHPSRFIRIVCMLLGGKKVIHTVFNMNSTPQYHAIIFQNVIRSHFSGIDTDVENHKMDFFINVKNVDQIKLSRYQNYMCIQPGGGNNLGESTRIKQWPFVNYIQLIKLIQGFSPIPILLTGDALDKDIAAAIAKEAPGVINVCGETNLDELAFLFSKSRVNISGDTGSMHLAATTDIPLITLFGPTDPVKLLPMAGKTELIKTAVDCAPCYFGIFRGCKTGMSNCMKEIPVTAVFNCVKKYL